MKTGWTTHSWNNAIWLALRPCHMTMTHKINLKNRVDHKAIFMPYLADLLPFMVIFERMLWWRSGPPAYHHHELLQTAMLFERKNIGLVKKRVLRNSCNSYFETSFDLRIFRNNALVVPAVLSVISTLIWNNFASI